MYIDGPNMLKRKVMLHPKNDNNVEEYQYGDEKARLGQYVREQLNEHSNDYLILEKFRKEAEELKRQKYEAKRKKTPPRIP